MAFSQNNIDRIRFDDPVTLLTEQNRRLLDKSWAGYFSREIFPKIDEARFAVLFCEERKGRYNVSVNHIVSMLILKELLRMTDGGIVQSVTFDLRFKYALNCTNNPNSPVSASSLARFRAKAAAYKRKTGADLIAEEYEALKEPLTKMIGRYRMKPAAGGRLASFTARSGKNINRNKSGI